MITPITCTACHELTRALATQLRSGDPRSFGEIHTVFACALEQAVCEFEAQSKSNERGLSPKPDRQLSLLEKP